MYENKGRQSQCFFSALAITTLFLFFFSYHHFRLSPIDHVYFRIQPDSLSSLSPTPDEEQHPSSPAPSPSVHLLLKMKASGDLFKVETSLSRARAAIQEAARSKHYTMPYGIKPISFVPLPRLYRNPYAFYRSQTEMIKRFKVWTYKEGDRPLFHEGPTKSIYGIEGQFIDEMDGAIRSTFMARHPRQAHSFFLPISLLKVRHFLLGYNSRTPMHRVVLDYLHVISHRYPFWNTSLGADHFLLSCHDWAPDVSNANPELLKNTMRALCNANTSEGFHPNRDISIPEINILGSLNPPTAHVSPTGNRTILAFFAGGQHGDIRRLLFDKWKEKDDDIRVHEHLPKGEDYFKLMGQSKFCLCPSGYEVASPRIVEAIHAECVPVLISSNYSLPFADVLDWRQFSVSIAVDEMSEIKTILKGITEKKYMRLVKGVRRVKWHFTLNRPAKPFDMIHMVLHSVWIRRLNIKLPFS